MLRVVKAKQLVITFVDKLRKKLREERDNDNKDDKKLQHIKHVVAYMDHLVDRPQPIHVNL